MIEYRIAPEFPEAHLFAVTIDIPEPDPAGQCLRMPAWIPGSYMIRDFARQVVILEASCGDAAVAVTKLDKQTWRCAPVDGPLRIDYQVYARDLSVRAAYLDTFRGYFNGTSVFLSVDGREGESCGVSILAPQGRSCGDWELATSLLPAGDCSQGFGRYLAENYLDLVDHPVEMGRFSRCEFSVSGVPHELVISGRHRADMERLGADLSRVCAQQVALFGELPCDRYLFMALASGDGYGGLEHRFSTSLICSRSDLPRAGLSAVDKGYRKFLGLCSHEYFHLWNVKRIRPRVFQEQGLEREVHTRLLWVFEGITSYYDDLAMVRCGLIEVEAYLQLLAAGITRLLRGNGRHKQSLEASSFDAWTKFYKQDESAPNNIVSYYTKGAIVALALDLTIRRDTGGKRSLDDVMRRLWIDYGKSDRGLGEGDIEPLIAEVTGLDLSTFLQSALRSTEDLDLPPLLEEFGVAMRLRPARGADDQGGVIAPQDEPEIPVPSVLGVRLDPAAKDAVIAHVLDGGAAQRAGLTAGDTVIAVDGLRALAANLDGLVAAIPGEASARIHVFRRDELVAFDVQPQPALADTCELGLIAEPSKPAAERRDAWLRGVG